MFDRIKDKIGLTSTKIIKARTEKGQSLVEMAIISPLLIFLLLGVFEIGNALRGYLALVNMNREITRFAVRPGYLDFSTEAAIKTSYSKVNDWIGTSLVDQLPLDFATEDNNGDGFADGNAAMIISHLVVDTAQPCQDIDQCVCNAFVEAYEAGQTYDQYLGISDHKNDDDIREMTLDDIIIHPGMSGHEFQKERFGPEATITGPKETRLDYEKIVTELKAYNNKFNCEIIKKGGLPSANNVIITEVFYDQSQLFGFPFISNPYTDPVPVYSHTSMRLASGARDLLENIDTVGPICISFPTTIRRSSVEPTPGNRIPEGTRIDILDGEGPSNFGWLTWNPIEDNEGYLHSEWLYPQLSINDYTNPASAGWDDHSLNIGDYVTTFGGIVSSSDIRATLESFAQSSKILVIPIWDDLAPDGFETFSNPDHDPGEPNSVKAYKIWGFIEVRLDPSGNIGHTLSEDKDIYAFYLGEPSNCPQITP